jgi:uncharacterized membrane protein YvlD (DUF360 family)
MANFLMKVIAIPILLMICAWLLPNVDYGAWYQPIVIGVLLAILGVMMEYLLLRKDTAWISTLADFIVNLLVIYYISNLYDGADVTFFGAFLTAVVLGIVEHVVHLWLIRSGRAEKSPA